ncbi:MAG: hypothetical protein IT204_04900 [Fimbriimonadaceae bacterium]|nr:hypothetical protein [Fimbriimonadaceae bacterium]
MSIVKWLTGAATGGDALSSARLDSELTELYHALAPHLQTGVCRSLAVASAEGREGRTRVALYLAELLADNLSGRVLLVEADRQRPALAAQYDLPPGPGLGEVLAGQATLAAVVQPTLRENQDVLLVGDTALTVGEQVSHDRLQRFLAEARETYATVIFDTAALLEAQEALVFCHSVQAVVLVVLAGTTQGELLARAGRLLQRARAPLLGVVVNDPRGEFQRHEG